MTREAKLISGITLIIVPTIQYGGYFLLTSLMSKSSGYMENPLRQHSFPAGNAHAGVIVLLSQRANVPMEYLLGQQQKRRHGHESSSRSIQERTRRLLRHRHTERQAHLRPASAHWGKRRQDLIAMVPSGNGRLRIHLPGATRIGTRKLLASR